jgi:alkylation response protein AidB-like acyl-CoA dehydrogenase
MIRDAVRQFAQDVIAPQAARMGPRQDVPKDVHKELAAPGRLRRGVPEELGGAGLTICRWR